MLSLRDTLLNIKEEYIPIILQVSAFPCFCESQKSKRTVMPFPHTFPAEIAEVPSLGIAKGEGCYKAAGDRQ